MTDEPMLNIREKAPLIIMGGLIAAHILRVLMPQSLFAPLQPWLILAPINVDAISVPQKLISLLGHGLLHADFSHLLMNGFMIVAFGIVTLTGLRANVTIRPQIFSPVQKFYLIFYAGIIGGGLFQWAWWSLSGQFAVALGASGGGSALFATMAYAIGGRDRLLKFGLGWCVINFIFAFAGPSFGFNIAWAAHLGGFAVGAIFALYWVRPKSADFKLN